MDVVMEMATEGTHIAATTWCITTFELMNRTETRKQRMKSETPETGAAI
jgi:hypothetical protein